MLGMTAVIRAIPAIIRKVLSFYGGLSRYIWLLHVTIIYIVQRYINPPEISLVILITNLAAVTLAAFAAEKGGEALQRRLIHRRRTS